MCRGFLKFMVLLHEQLMRVAIARARALKQQSMEFNLYFVMYMYDITRLPYYICAGGEVVRVGAGVCTARVWLQKRGAQMDPPLLPRLRVPYASPSSTLLLLQTQEMKFCLFKNLQKILLFCIHKNITASKM